MISRAALSFVLIAALLASRRYADASELLANGGFEQGPAGWSLTAGQLDAVASPVHEGALAARFSGSSQPATQLVFQLVNVLPGQSYELSGWISATPDSGINRAFLRLWWFDGNGQLLLSEDSSWLPQPDAAFHRLTTGARVSPTAARQARTSMLVQADVPFNVLLDDFAFSGPAAIPPPPDTPTPAPSSAPTPAPGTVTPTSTPRPPSPTRTPAPQQTPGSSAEATPAPAAEPVVFPHLINAGFEDLRGDGTPFGWHKQGGDMMTVMEPRTEGSRALMLRSDTSSTKWVYQTIAVQGGAYYAASVEALAGQGAESAFLRLSWYASADGSGQAISSTDSPETTISSDAGFRGLATGPVRAPPVAQSAKMRLMLRPSSGEPAAAYFDAAIFGETQLSEGEIVSGVGAAAVAAGRFPARAGADEAETPVSGAPTPVSLANIKPARADASDPQAPGRDRRDDWAILLAIGIAVAAVALAGGYELWQRRTRLDGGADDGA